MHNILTTRNRLYAKFKINNANIGQPSDVIIIQNENEELTELFTSTVENTNSYNETVTQNRTQIGGINDVECVVVNNHMKIDERKNIAFLNLLKEHDKSSTFVAQTSGDILKYNHPRFFEFIFPHLFQFGCGGPKKNENFGTPIPN